MYIKKLLENPTSKQNNITSRVFSWPIKQQKGLYCVTILQQYYHNQHLRLQLVL